MAYIIQVRTYLRGQPSWTGNAVEYDTAEEAIAAGADLLRRWTVPDAYRVVSHVTGIGPPRAWDGREIGGPASDDGSKTEPDDGPKAEPEGGAA